MQILKDYSKSIISYRVILSLFCNLVFVSFILSQNINYISIEHSLSSYFKLTPSIAHPFDHKDFFYANLDNSYSDNALSINQTYRRNKKIKSVKKLKQFKSKIEGGENENTYVIYNTHHGNNVSIPVVVDLNWYFPNALAHNQRFELEKKITKKITSRSNRRNIPDAALRLINQDIAGTNVALNIRGDISVNGEIIFENKDLIALNSNENKSFDIDIEQTQRFDLEGKIGEKLTLNATQAVSYTHLTLPTKA